MPNSSLEIEITLATELTEDLFEACQRLVPQLTHNNPPPTKQQLAQMLASPVSFLFFAKHPDYGDEIIGMATLVLYHVPTGLRGYVEDIVVDGRARGKRIGEILTRACLDHAIKCRCSTGDAHLQPGQEFSQPDVRAHGFRAAQDECVPVFV